MIILINISVKKTGKNILPFYYLDTACPAKASYNILTKKFTIDDNDHIEW